jgi:hypothetical protein
MLVLTPFYHTSKRMTSGTAEEGIWYAIGPPGVSLVTDRNRVLEGDEPVIEEASYEGAHVVSPSGVINRETE